MRRLTIAILAVTMLVAGCGVGQDKPIWVQTPTSAIPAPTPSALTVAEAGRRYLEIVAPYNEALEALETAANTGKSWTTVRSLAAEVAETNKSHGRALRGTVWPEEVRTAMDALLTEIDTAQRYWERAAGAKTVDELASAIQSASRHSGAEAAGQVRVALGLPAYSES